VVLDELETAVDDRGTGVCLKCCTCQFEQDDESIRLVIVQFRMRYKRLEDVIVDPRFPHPSKIGPVCNEINVCVVLSRETVTTTVFVVPRDVHIMAEEFFETLGAEAALQSWSVWANNVIRLCITREAKEQVNCRVDEFTVCRHNHRPRCSVVPDLIQGWVRGDLAISLLYIEPKAIKCE